VRLAEWLKRRFLTDDTAPVGTIIGFNPQWTSSAVLGASPGVVYIESLGGTISGTPVDITPSSPSNNTWYHVYVYSSDGTTAGTPTLEASTTAPVAFATPAGFARSKTGDTSRRYLYSARTNGSGQFYQFACDQQGLFKWKNQNLSGSPFRVLSAGSATSSTNVDCSAVVPTTARSIFLEIVNTSTTTGVFVTSGDVTATSTDYELECAAVPAAGAIIVFGFIGCDASQTLNYLNSTGGGAVYLDVCAFNLQR